MSLAASSAKFGAATSYHVRYTMGASGREGELQGEAAYQADAAVYVRTTVAGAHPANADLASSLFLPPELYVQRGDGTWFVQSPWNLGVRPSEQSPPDPNLPIIDYRTLARDLHEIEVRPDATPDGKPLMRHHGDIVLADLVSLVGPGATGTAQADIWIDESTALPARVEIHAGGENAFAVTVNFVDYNLTAAAPPKPIAARPFRDAQFPDAPCTGTQLAGCLEAQAEISAVGDCAGSARRVCFVPLGKISPQLVANLVSYYRDQFGLQVTVTKPAAIPADFADPKRGQVAADRLIGYMQDLLPGAYADQNAVMIGLTPIDVYDGTSQFRYIFGLKGTAFDPKAIVSSARMDPLFYSAPKDSELFYTRTRKLVSKYIGLLYYRLPESSDPTSPMFNRVWGPDAVDMMTEPLPVAGH